MSSRRKKRAQDSRLRKERVTPERLRAQVRRSRLLRPAALLLLIGSFGGAAALFHTPLLASMSVLFGAMLALVLFLTTDYHCPICRGPLVLDEVHGPLRMPGIIRCDRCRVRGGL